MHEGQEVVVDYIDIRIGGCVLTAHKDFVLPLNRSLKRMVIVASVANSYSGERVHITVVPKFGTSSQVLLHRLTQRFTPRMRTAHMYLGSPREDSATIGIKFVLVQTSTSIIADQSARFVSECDKSGLVATIRLQESCSFIAEVLGWQQSQDAASAGAIDSLTATITDISTRAGIHIANVVLCPTTDTPTTTLLEEMRKPLVL